MTAKSKLSRGSTLTGNAGEHYVMAELLKRGVVAALAPRNAPDFDILATNGRKTARIRVKTKSERARGWRWNAKKDGSVFGRVRPSGDYIVFVHLAGDVGQVAYYIAKTASVAKWLKAGHSRWLATPDRDGQPHRDNSIRCLPLPEFRDRLSTDWDLLWR
jgi:hypothetical protein